MEKKKLLVLAMLALISLIFAACNESAPSLAPMPEAELIETPLAPSPEEEAAPETPEHPEGRWDDDRVVIKENAPEQLVGTWENNMGETYVISHEIPQGEHWIMTRLPNGSYRILVENDSGAHYEKWFFPLGTEMVRYGTNWSLVPSDTSRERLFVGTFTLTTCCPDEEILQEVFYRTTESVF